ncbi:conserved Plasmodium protein, unknown function [Plasmodium vivax]|uniref:Uncharacterized protein n=2 Tax=Plasmodium vivax TaxID=5855 RepID=A5KEB4_PLAVS|nr:hypothetical protein, conserved [Plasmodium vivax]EDL42332.1 hypothetical protein, conserved [Plasmodium vivax]KMZ87284.1 hypothetical protein PVBG_05275 [Plasmodium vivax Brazil I]CAI7719778.1 conserved Plasmodium protein, unknown function [Plasmodium vivax]|eukprot:XP_001608356.1 hypothetical protein [Plasmodium vivax Sal-1]
MDGKKGPIYDILPPSLEKIKKTDRRRSQGEAKELPRNELALGPPQRGAQPLKMGPTPREGAKQMKQHTEETKQHTEQTKQHTEQTKQHTEQTKQHTEQTKQHTKHTGHTEQTERAANHVAQKYSNVILSSDEISAIISSNAHFKTLVESEKVSSFMGDYLENPLVAIKKHGKDETIAQFLDCLFRYMTQKSRSIHLANLPDNFTIPRR